MRLLIAAALALTATATAAQVLDAAGKIISVKPPGAAQVISAKGVSRQAHYAGLLYPGDRIAFSGQGAVLADVHGHEVEYHPGGDLTVPTRPSGPFSAESERYMRGFERFLGQPRRAIVAFPYARGEDEGSGPAVSPEPLAPTGVQYLEPGTRRIGLVWSGNATALLVQTGTKTQTVASNNQAWATIEAPAASAWAVASKDGRLNWSLKVAASAPTPVWLAARPVTSEADRLSRAVWILREGPPTWRLFALGELSALASAGNFAAEQIWAAVRSGEWSEWTPAVATGER